MSYTRDRKQAVLVPVSFASAELHFLNYVTFRNKAFYRQNYLKQKLSPPKNQFEGILSDKAFMYGQWSLF